MKRDRQHSKGKKRPRSWHRGRAAGQKGEAALVRVEREFDRAERQDRAAEDARAAIARDAADHRELLRELDRVSPHVPAFEIGL